MLDAATYRARGRGSGAGMPKVTAVATLEQTGSDTLTWLERRIARLVAHRQELRDAGAEGERLEANRREIVSAQQALSGLLIERYVRHAA
jgi:hypothetical protein